MEVKFRQRAYLDIENIIAYIIAEGYPQTAFKFLQETIEFCNSLGFLSEKYPICRFAALQKRNYRCAVFRGNYIVAYKIEYNKVEVKRIFHTARLKG